MSSRKFRSQWPIALLFVIATLTACNVAPQTQTALPPAALPVTSEYPLPTTLPASPGIAPAYPAITPPSPTIIEPTTPALPQSSGAILAFLKDGDIWLLDEPGGQPYPLSVTGDIISFAWAYHGERIAAFNGKSICFIHRDGSVRTACLELGLNETQAKIKRNILLSRDQRWIVLWNPAYLQAEDEIGWMIVALDGADIMYRINNPDEWGAGLSSDNEPGGFTGEPIFLADNQLIGTLSHRNSCSEDGCLFQLYQFDLAAKTFSPYPPTLAEGFSGGARLMLSADLRYLSNFNVFKTDCENAYSLIDTLDIQALSRQNHRLDQESVTDLDFKPGLVQAVLAREASCYQPVQPTWAATCGLVKDQESLPMQLWNIATGERKDIYPGLTPRWSPDGDWIAFQSCLVKDNTGSWTPAENIAVSVYLFKPETGELHLVSDGAAFQWRPKP